MPNRYTDQQKYFEQAYTTGSDIWTHFPYETKAAELLEKLPQNSIILDLGSGRGTWAFELVEKGYRAIGIDYAKRAVDKANADAAVRNLASKVRFVEGDVLDMAFKDSTFDAAADFGLLQHLHPEDWERYAAEVARTIKPGGYFLLVGFSKETPAWLGFNPKAAATGGFEKYGIHYYFFAKEEIAKIFEKYFEIVEQKNETLSTPNTPVFLSTLFKKK
ncbi:MAG: class I SAM-dependent methyltransferase [Candidatus Niyogibacteria bacterium]|nr:class I SAM-dependent methyltransferase [Candidatus Niyogibacteria bacterium]